MIVAFAIWSWRMKTSCDVEKGFVARSSIDKESLWIAFCQRSERPPRWMPWAMPELGSHLLQS